MIPLLGYLAVKYLINYPRFLFTTLPSLVHCRYEQLGVKQKVLLFVHQQEGWRVGRGQVRHGGHHGGWL